VLGCASFADAIGVNGWPIENHVAGDVKWEWPAEGSRGYNQLPWRMLVAALGAAQPPRRRTLRLDDARGPIGARVSGACFVMGEAAGTAAALALAGAWRRGSCRRRRLPRHWRAEGHSSDNRPSYPGRTQ
jgi:hypothetical protein